MPKKILIVEDNPDILDILEIIFSTDQFEPVTSRRALPVDEVARLAPDLVLLDHWLGDRLGSELCKDLKGYPPTSGIPVVLLSAHINLLKLANDSCADGFIEKPFDIYELYDYVESVVYKCRIA